MEKFFTGLNFFLAQLFNKQHCFVVWLIEIKNKLKRLWSRFCNRNAMKSSTFHKSSPLIQLFISQVEIEMKNSVTQHVDSVTQPSIDKNTQSNDGIDYSLMSNIEDEFELL